MFFPPAALDAVLLQRDAALLGASGDALPASMGAGGVGGGGSGGGSKGKGWRGGLCRTPPMPAQDGEGGREDGSGAARARLRRWSFAGQARFGTAGGGGGGGGNKARHERQVQSVSLVFYITIPGRCFYKYGFVFFFFL